MCLIHFKSIFVHLFLFSSCKTSQNVFFFTYVQKSYDEPFLGLRSHFKAYLGRINYSKCSQFFLYVS